MSRGGATPIDPVAEVENDVIERYRRARVLADSTRKEWEQQGQPLITEGPNGVEYEHPLCKLVRETEKDAARLARDIPRPAKRPGRKPAVTTSITSSPASKRRLRAV